MTRGESRAGQDQCSVSGDLWLHYCTLTPPNPPLLSGLSSSSWVALADFLSLCNGAVVAVGGTGTN